MKVHRGVLEFVALSFCLVAALAASDGSALAAPIHIDRSFGSDGIAAPYPGPTYGWLWYENVTQEADGRILATLNAGANSGPPVVHRYLPDGQEDPSFAPRPATGSVYPEATLANGSVLKAVLAPDDHDALERLNPDGTKDETYGHAGVSDPVPGKIRQILAPPSGQVYVTSYQVHVGARGPTVNEPYVSRLDGSGSLETAFGGGSVNLRTLLGTEQMPQGIVARQAGGVVVALSNAYVPSSNSGTTLVALTGAGAPDPGYGGAGVTTLDSTSLAIHAVAGGLEVVGTQPEGSNSCCSLFRVIRLTDQGQPDPAFGEGDGIASADFGGRDEAQAALWGADGSVVLAGVTTAAKPGCEAFGTCWREPALARFSASGQLEPSFGEGGQVTLDRLRTGGPLFPAYGSSLSLSQDVGGGLFLAGEAASHAFVAALDAGGRLRPGFADDGLLTSRRPERSSALVSAMAADRRGRILVAGSTTAGEATGILGRHTVTRYRRGGAIDRRYGRDGIASVGVSYGNLSALAVDRAGRALVVQGSAVMRLTAGGRPDRSFGSRGVAQLSAGLELDSIVALRGGKILLAGRSGARWLGRAVVVRLLSNGKLDRSFGRGGVDEIRCGGGRACAATGLAVQRNGRILLSGYMVPRSGEATWRRSAFAVGRLLWDGRLDARFGRRGWAVTRFGRASGAFAVARQGHRVLVAGWAGSGKRLRAVLVGYRADGRVDRRFAVAGVSRRSVGRFNSFEPFAGGTGAKLLPTKRTIFVVRAGTGTPVLAYKGNGRRQRFRGEGRLVPRRYFASFLSASPSGALQRGRPVIAWNQTTPSGHGGTASRVVLRRLTR